MDNYISMIQCYFNVKEKQLNKKNKNTKKTHDQYVKELAQKNPNMEVLETYINSKSKIKHRCKYIM